MGLLSSMGANVSGLMFETVEGPVTQWTFVWTWELLTGFVTRGPLALHGRRHEAGWRRHGAV